MLLTKTQALTVADLSSPCGDMTLTADTGTLRVLSLQDKAAVERLLDQDQIAHCFVGSRLEDPHVWQHGDIWGWFENGQLISALHHGANLIPIASTQAARNAFIKHLRTMHRRCSSIVGPAEEVIDLWTGVRPGWGPARDIRAHQPVLAMTASTQVPADPAVRVVRPHEIDVLLPACVDMFTEEVGVSPVSGGAVGPYRNRILDIITAGRSLARIEDGQVIFKAEVGAVWKGVAQVQGVWVRPDRRGEGLSVAGMAAVVEHVRAHIAPTVSLYVNDFNTAARSAYTRVGFQQVGVFATVLF